MKKSFKEGDVVQLKSGSQLMVISKISGNNITLIWQDKKTNKFIEKEFTQSVLCHSVDTSPKKIIGMVIK